MLLQFITSLCYRCGVLVFRPSKVLTIARCGALTAAVFATVFAFVPIALAGAIEVSPTKIELTNKQRIKSVVFRNMAPTDVVLSLKAYSWQQEQGKDNYTVTDDLLVTPPLIRIPSKGSQLIRVGLLHQLPNTIEHSYRLYATEVIPKALRNDNMLKISLRIGIPIFVLPKIADSKPLTWQLQPRGKDFILSAVNPANVHKLITDVSLSRSNSAAALWQEKIFAYMLPGSEQRWLIPGAKMVEPVAKNETQFKVNASAEYGDIVDHLTLTPSRD